MRIALMAMVIFLVAGCGRQSSVSNTTLYVGIPAPFSGGGAEYGDFMRKGATLAAEEWNQKTSAGGFKIELRFEDGQGLPAETRNAAERLIVRDSVQIVTDAFNSSATLAILPLAQSHKIPLLVGLSTADAVTEQNNPWVFRICASNTSLSSRLCEFIIRKQKPQTVAFIYEKTDFGTNLASTVKERLEKAGVRVVAFEGVNQHEADFLSLISKLKILKPDMVFLGILTDSAIPFLRQARSAGFRARWVNAVSLSNPKFLKDAGDLAEGFVGITHFESTTAKGAAKEFVDDFTRKYNSMPTHYSAVYYDEIMVIADAARRGGLSREGIFDALKKTDYEGITGRIRFGPGGQASIGTIIFEWTKGQQVVLETQ
jgi:branched-chain amino acid transport system substrate-binding protein